MGAKAQAQFDSGDIAGARQSIDKAIAARDDNVDLHLLKGRIEVAGKSLDAAFLSFYNAMSLDPVNQAALQSVAMLGLQTGHVDEAENAAGKLLTLSPQHPAALLVRGLIALERKRFPEALAAADGILANNPTDENAIILKSRALYLSGQRDPAKQLIRQTVALAGPSPGMTRIVLEMARAEGDPETMLRAIAELVRGGHGDAQLTFDEANVRYKINDRAGAEAIIHRGLLDEKAGADQQTRLLDLWREYDPAAPSPARLPQPRTAAVRESLARYLLEHGRPDDSIRLIDMTDSATARGLRARILLAKRQIGQSRALAEAVVASDPGQCDARIALATIALEDRQPDRAVTNGQQAAAECPGQIDGWLITARSYEQAGQNRQVDRVFRDAMGRVPDNERLHAAYVDWLKRVGRAGQAPAVVRHLVRFAPNRISTWRLLAAACVDDTCRANAQRGLANAQRSLVVDRRPGELPPRGLLSGLSKGSCATDRQETTNLTEECR